MHDRHHQADRRVGHPLDHGLEERLLRVEVVVEGALRRPDLVDHVLEAELLVALRLDQPLGGVDERVAPERVRLRIEGASHLSPNNKPTIGLLKGWARWNGAGRAWRRAGVGAAWRRAGVAPGGRGGCVAPGGRGAGRAWGLRGVAPGGRGAGRAWGLRGVARAGVALAPGGRGAGRAWRRARGAGAGRAWGLRGVAPGGRGATPPRSRGRSARGYAPPRSRVCASALAGIRYLKTSISTSSVPKPREPARRFIPTRAWDGKKSAIRLPGSWESGHRQPRNRPFEVWSTRADEGRAEGAGRRGGPKGAGRKRRPKGAGRKGRPERGGPKGAARKGRPGAARKGRPKGAGRSAARHAQPDMPPRRAVRRTNRRFEAKSPSATAELSRATLAPG